MEVIGRLVVGFVLIIGLALVVAFPVMWLWNYVMPDLFGLIEIGFWQALALSMLSSVLFKSTSSTKSD